MLRIHFLQHWFNLADLACKEALYDSASQCRFAGIDLGREAVPDATSLLRFRHLLEQHQLGEQLSAVAGRALPESGMTLKTGTIVDAAIIAAPSSTKNADGKRDPEMRQTRKGKQWSTGMKLHIGLSYSAMVSAANVHGKYALVHLIHGQEKRVYGDNAYRGRKPLIHSRAPQAEDFANVRVQRRKDEPADEATHEKSRNKSKVQARVEHVFAVAKRLWGFSKVRYRGLVKNACRAFTALGLANIYLSRH
jgi:IS5 family transposase